MSNGLGIAIKKLWLCQSNGCFYENKMVVVMTIKLFMLRQSHGCDYDNKMGVVMTLVVVRIIKWLGCNNHMVVFLTIKQLWL